MLGGDVFHSGRTASGNQGHFADVYYLQPESSGDCVLHLQRSKDVATVQQRSWAVPDGGELHSEPVSQSDESSADTGMCSRPGMHRRRRHFGERAARVYGHIERHGRERGGECGDLQREIGVYGLRAGNCVQSITKGAAKAAPFFHALFLSPFLIGRALVLGGLRAGGCGIVDRLEVGAL